jgi:hypothetical protein
VTAAHQQRTAALTAVSVACLAVATGGPAVAGTWGAEPTVALSADYGSNPRLLLTAVRAAEAAAITVNLPATYQGDSETIDLRPSFRAAATHGDSGLISDFQNFDGALSRTGERYVLQAAASWHRDSTLNNPLENTSLLGASLRRREQSAQVSWKILLSERNQMSVSASWDQVKYTPSYQQGLVDYNYPQASLQFSRELSERLRWQLGAGSARYQLSNKTYRTDSPFINTGFVEQLSEAWSLTGSIGASRQEARYQFGPYVFRRPPHTSTTFSLALERHDATRALSMSYSRSLQPSGYGAVLTQDVLSLSRHFTWSERWSGTASVSGTRQVDWQGRLAYGDRKFLAVDLATSWLWTEQWTVFFEVGYNQQRLIPLPEASSTAAYLTFTRQFGRRTLH